MSQQRVVVDITEDVAEVRLSRPEKRNALDAEMFSAVVAAGEELRANAGLRAVVLSAEGPDFCAGLDFAALGAMRTGDRVSATLSLPPNTGPARSLGQRAAHVWSQVPVPVIAAISGHALGGGLQIALGADIRIVAPDAVLSVLEITWGLVPDMAGTQTLPELVGRDVAKELVLTGRRVSGEEAVDIGLATFVDAQPREAALALARTIATRNPDAVRAAKRLLDLAGRVDLAEGLAAEQAEIAELIGSPNQVAAIAAAMPGRRT